MVLAGLYLAFAAGTAAPQRPEDPKGCGDRAFVHRADPARAREAFECYRQAHEASPEDTEAAWRYSMACQFIGYRLTKETEDKLKIFAAGRDVASAAAKAKPDCGPCHFWGGINRALFGETSGIFRTIATLGIVKQDLERAAEIDPAYAYGGPDRILGLIDQKVPGILGGSDTDAAAHFEKAITLAPTNPLNYLFLARLQKDEIEDDAAFKAVLIRAKAMVKMPLKEDVESYEAWSELKALGAELEEIPSSAQDVKSEIRHLRSAMGDG